MIVGKVSSSHSLLFPSLSPPLVTLRQPMAWASQWLWASQAECPHVFPLQNRLQTFDFESSLCSTWRKKRINLPNIPEKQHGTCLLIPPKNSHQLPHTPNPTSQQNGLRLRLEHKAARPNRGSATWRPPGQGSTLAWFGLGRFTLWPCGHVQLLMSLVYKCLWNSPGPWPLWL